MQDRFHCQVKLQVQTLLVGSTTHTSTSERLLKNNLVWEDGGPCED